jgi:hypothetical protein
MIGRIAAFLVSKMSFAPALLLGFFPKLIMPLLITLLAVSLYTIGHIKGTNACQMQQVKQDLKEMVKYDKIRQGTDGLSDSELDKRLRQYTRDK